MTKLLSRLSGEEGESSLACSCHPESALENRVGYGQPLGEAYPLPPPLAAFVIEIETHTMLKRMRWGGAETARVSEGRREEGRHR